eukprot:Tbor_TRINITY_DN5494_c0_g2::TRINITY_DN5494_c0_g2_i2::g.24856::m.24856
MRPTIILVLIPLMVFYCLMYTEYVDNVSEAGYVSEADYSISAAKIRKNGVEFDPIQFFPNSTYNVSIVNWTLTCTRSPAYLADLAYTVMQITDVLEELGIMYILDFATMLGAIRMNGPLPYDDDIDITVFEEDFTPKKHLVYDAMEKRNFRVERKSLQGFIDQFYHINQSSDHGILRPSIDLFLLKESSDKRNMVYACLLFKRLSFCPYKKSTIFGQAPPLSIPTMSAPRAPQVIPRALEAVWYHYKDHQRKT